MKRQGLLSSALRRITLAGAWVMKSEGEPERGTVPHAKLRFWIALGIVLAAVSTAAAAWRAEIFTEYAAQKEALFRQDVTAQQLSERLDEETVASGLRQFGSYEQDVTLASAFQRQADRTHIPHLAAQAQNERALANLTLATNPSLENVAGGEGQHHTVISDPAGAYSATVLNDQTIATYDPGALDADAHLARDDAVATAVIGVLFALAVVLLTLSEMQLRRQREDREVNPVVGYVFAGSAATIWFGSLVLLLVILISDIPRLQ